MITTAAELRRRAWRERGILTIEIDTVENAWERQVLVNLASRLYGPCRAPESHGGASEAVPLQNRSEPLILVRS
jgi:hypothetical protein